MSATTAPTSVQIYGAEYRIRGTDDPEFVEAVARAVDQRMREIAQRAQAVNQTQLAVLTLMNLAGELLRTQERLADLDAQVSHRVGELVNRVSTCLDAAR